MAPKESKRLRITWVKSAIGYAENQKRTIRARGRRRRGQVVVKNDAPEIRGMVATVSHLIRVEEVNDEGA